MEVTIDISEYLKELETLVNQDSGSTYPEGVAKVADFFHRQYEAMGWFVEKQNLDPAIGPCLEIKNKESDSYDILLIGHMDTVFPKGTTANRPFSIKGNRAYGPGVGDMKSGLLLMYHVLRSLNDEGALTDRSICVALNSDEEISSAYSRPWLEDLSKKSRFAGVFEGARNGRSLVNERKGVARYTVDFKGVAAHSGVDHEKGRSAIGEMGHWIVALHGLTNYETGTTVNVGVVSGGAVPNMVAEWAQARIDLRFKDVAAPSKIEDAMNRLAMNPKIQGVSAKVTGGITRPPMNPSEETLKLCKKIEAIGSELGMAVKWTRTGGGSDGNLSAALGVPTIDGLGPAGGRAHSPEEYLEIDSVDPQYRLVTEIIRRL